MLQSVQVSDAPNATDHLFWGHTPSGLFSTKSALQIIRHDRRLTEDKGWEKIWKLQSQQRVRSFVFLTAHDAILSNTNKVRRHISLHDACPRCTKSETSMHLLRDCDDIQKVWRTVGADKLPPDFFTDQDIQRWVFNNTKAGDRWSSIFAQMAWLTWKARNTLVFEGKDSTKDLHLRVWKQVSIFLHTKNKWRELTAGHTVAPVEPITWYPPPRGWVKLNSDGVSKGNPGPAGGAGIFRDSVGQFLHAYTFKSGFCDAFKAELLATLHGLKTGERMGFTNLIVEVDSSDVYKALSSGEFESHANHHLIVSCRSKIQNPNWNVQISNVKRQANATADTLANWALTLVNSFDEHTEPPSCIRDILYAELST